MEHVRETTTPQGDGTLLADCSCGASYIVPQGSDEFGALEMAHAAHRLGAVIPPVTGLLADFTADELEALVITAAELWNGNGDAHEVLSERQLQLCAMAYALLGEQ